MKTIDERLFCIIRSPSLGNHFIHVIQCWWWLFLSAFSSRCSGCGILRRLVEMGSAASSGSPEPEEAIAVADRIAVFLNEKPLKMAHMLKVTKLVSTMLLGSLLFLILGETTLFRNRNSRPITFLYRRKKTQRKRIVVRKPACFYGSSFFLSDAMLHIVAFCTA